MTTNSYSSTAKALIANFGNAAHQAIGLYREGGERLADAAGQRWKAALKKSSPKLTPETRKNAAHAKDVFGGYYAKGLAMSTDGAKVAVDTFVGAAIAAVERAESFKHQYARKTA